MHLQSNSCNGFSAWLVSLRFQLSVPSVPSVSIQRSSSTHDLHDAHRNRTPCQAPCNPLRLPKDPPQISLSTPTVRPHYLGTGSLPKERKASVRISVLRLRSPGTFLSRLSDPALTGSLRLAPHLSRRGRDLLRMVELVRRRLGIGTSDRMCYCKITHDV